jgi:4-amino-4-deoxy-L-arabinose transferase-like glycosyltransferase
MKKFLPIVIVFLALILRLYHFTLDPPPAYSDEVAIGYNAYSILTTGKDEWGTPYPVLFRSFGDYKPPVYIYTVAFFEKFLGPTDLAVRLPAALFGTLTVLVLFFLVKELGFTDLLGYCATFLLAISPWHLQFTRAGFEASQALFFVVTGVWLFIKSTKNNIWWLLLSMLVFSLATMTYHNARVFLPLFVPVLFFLYRTDFKKKIKHVLIILCLTLVFNLPNLPSWVSPEGRARLTSESILNESGNLITNLQQNFVANYSLDYLFFRGDQAGRHSVKKLGETFVWQLPFYLVGLYLLIKKRDKTSFIILGWLLFSGFPAAITRISPHALRGLLMVIPLTIICTIAIIKIKKYWWIFLPVILFNLFLYLHVYYYHYPRAYAADWSDGVEETVKYLAANQNKYDQIFVHPDLSPEYLLFYLPFPPDQLQKQNHLTSQLGKFSYHNFFTEPVKNDPTKKSLAVAPKLTIPKKVEVLREFRMVNGDSVFQAYEF